MLKKSICAAILAALLSLLLIFECFADGAMLFGRQSVDLYRSPDVHEVFATIHSFRERVNVQEAGNGCVAVYSFGASISGYCDSDQLIRENAVYYAEIPFQCRTETDGVTRSSQLIDLRKYLKVTGTERIEIDAPDDETVLLQQDTFFKLLRAVNSSELRIYTIHVVSAYSFDAEASVNRKRGVEFEILVTAGNTPIEIIDGTDSKGNPLSPVAQAFMNAGFSRTPGTNVFTDGNAENYLPVNLDPLALTYVILY